MIRGWTGRQISDASATKLKPSCLAGVIRGVTQGTNRLLVMGYLVFARADGNLPEDRQMENQP